MWEGLDLNITTTAPPKLPNKHAIWIKTVGFLSNTSLLFHSVPPMLRRMSPITPPHPIPTLGQRNPKASHVRATCIVSELPVLSFQHNVNNL